MRFLIGQEIRLTETLLLPVTSQAAGKIHFPVRHILPEGIDGRAVSLVAAKDRVVSHRHKQIGSAYGVADRFVLFGHPLVVLPVRRRLPALTAAFQQEMRKVEITPLARRPVEFHQGQFNLLVAGDNRASRHQEGIVDKVRVAFGDIQESSFPGGEIVCHRRLVHMPDIVKLVAGANIVPALRPRLWIHIQAARSTDGIKIPVRLLRGPHQGDEAVHILVERRIIMGSEAVGGRLHHLEHIGIVIAESREVRRIQACGTRKVGNASGFLTFAEGERNGVIPHDALSFCEKTVREVNVRERNALDRIVLRLFGGAGGQEGHDGEENNLFHHL